jgi:hypothetical protein
MFFLISKLRICRVLKCSHAHRRKGIDRVWILLYYLTVFYFALWSALRVRREESLALAAPVWIDQYLYDLHEGIVRVQS